MYVRDVEDPIKYISMYVYYYDSKDKFHYMQLQWNNLKIERSMTV